jgi:carbon storage regulator
MLVLSRKQSERIFIGDNIVITVVDIDKGKVRLGIECPRNIAIYREEIRPQPVPPPVPLADQPMIPPEQATIGLSE